MSEQDDLKKIADQHREDALLIEKHIVDAAEVAKEQAEAAEKRKKATADE